MGGIAAAGAVVFELIGFEDGVLILLTLVIISLFYFLYVIRSKKYLKDPNILPPKLDWRGRPKEEQRFGSIYYISLLMIHMRQ